MPAWARKSRSKSPHPGSRTSGFSPDPRWTGSRSYSPRTFQRESLSPGALSPAGRQTSRSPSVSPATGLVPVRSTVTSSALLPSAAHGEDIESTRHSEELAVGVYVIARHAVRLLARLEPVREPGEVDELDQQSWLDRNTALDLQRHCFELCRHLDRHQGDRSSDDVARRKVQDQLANALLEILDYTESVVNERSLSEKTSSSHLRHVYNCRVILSRLVGE
jgi:hypothetical protein